MKKTDMKCASEHDEQVQLFKWMAYVPQLKYAYAIPCGGKRNLNVAVKLKAEGVKRGVPDLCVPLPRGGFHGMYIELKSIKGSVSEDQRDYLDYLNNSGYYACICFGFENAKAEIERYLEFKL